MPDLQSQKMRARACELAGLFKLAEDKIKLVENLNLELSIPAINELRYAGYHITQFIASETPEAANEEFGKAEKHCKRAIYDAAEAGVTYQLEMIKIFQTDFRTLSIRKTISNYNEIRKQIKAASTLILTPRGKVDRSAYYEECAKHLETLQVAHEELESYRDDLIQELKQENRTARIFQVAVATLAVGAGAFFYTAMAYHFPNTQSAPPIASASPITSSPALPALLPTNPTPSPAQ